MIKHFKYLQISFKKSSRSNDFINNSNIFQNDFNLKFQA